MHDLKNMISQQELVVGNAQRFKHRPEFVDDVIRTIEASVNRMRKVIERLQAHDRGDSTSMIDVGKLLAEVVNACSDRAPAPALRSLPAGIHVVANKDKLAMALTHAIRNAQDATREGGMVAIGCSTSDGRAVIEIVDDGVGMDEDFVRHRLFKPFDSTKGAQGMGIGAYQIQETFRAAGGSVEVSSQPGSGTTLRLSMPLAVSASAAGDLLDSPGSARRRSAS
jgi:putative PEP-CTERM system histidine kinase